MLPRTEQETLCVQKRVPGEIREILRPFVFLSPSPNQSNHFYVKKFPGLQVDVAASLRVLGGKGNILAPAGT